MANFKEKSVLSNCLLQSLIILFFVRGSRIKYYWNSKYKVISFYIEVRGKYKITFKRDRTKPVIVRNFLFYVKPNYSLV